MDHENRLDPPNNVDFAFDHVEDVMHGMQNLITWLSKTLKLKDRQMMAKKFFHEHPILCVFIGVSVLMCAVPVSCFFAFAVTTASFLFIGFLIVEGTILTCAFLVLMGTVFIVTCLSILCSMIIVALYYVAMLVYQVSAGMKQRLVSENVVSHSD